MTKDEILALVPGRELDRAVHRTLFHRHSIEGEWYCDGNHEKNEACDWQELPWYSTDIADAWQVVVAMAGKGFSCITGLNAACLQQQEAKFYSSWRGLGHSLYNAETTPGFEDVSDSMPLSICRAALLALSEQPSTPQP